MERPNRNISKIYTRADGCPDILFMSEEYQMSTHPEPYFMRPYTEPDIENVFRIMGCLSPLNTSMASWIFSFLNHCPEEAADSLLNTDGKSIFSNPQSHKCSNYIVLTRMQFHRLICAALYIHHYKKIRYTVDFRLALDFKEQRRSMIILLSGAPGTGKSTIASLIASRLSINHILSTDSVRHAMRTLYSKEVMPIIHCSTYECGDIIDPDNQLSMEDRCLRGYNAQADAVGEHLIKVISSFAESRTSLIVEGVHLSPNVLMKIVQTFSNVIPFLIYIKKEDFHKQRFAVRAKYMTTDPSENKYISNFSAIRLVQKCLSTGASAHLIPKIDNRNIDRSLETMHQTIFSYLKKLEGRPSMYDPTTQKLNFLDSVWKRRKRKLESKAKAMKSIKSLSGQTPTIDKPDELTLAELLDALPREGANYRDDVGGNLIIYKDNGTMEMQALAQPPPEPEPIKLPEMEVTFSSLPDFAETETENDPAEITLTDFLETTDSEFPDSERRSMFYIK